MRAASVHLLLWLPLLPACNNKAYNGRYENREYTTPTAYASDEIRIVEQRPHPTIPGREILCTEPSPDVAEALSTAAQLQANGGNGAANAGLGAGLASQETLSELAGRSTALLGLRDGLFRACEAYANAAIGDAAYALILSRYGQLMVTLFLGQDAQGAGSGGQAAAFASTALQLSLQQPKSDTSSAPSTTTPKGGTPQTPQAPKNTSLAAPEGLIKQIALLSDPAAAAAPPTHGAVPPAPVSPRAGGPGTPSTKETQTTPTSGGNGGSSKPSADAGSAAANAIEYMQKNYIDIDTDPRAMLHLLFVACVNEFDPSRPNYSQMAAGTGQPARAENTFLTSMCNFRGLQTWISALVQLQPRPAPAIPERPAIKPAAARPSESVQALQRRLQVDQDYAGPIDGFHGSQTEQALREYLAKHGTL